MAELIRWWKNKYAVAIISVGVLTVIIAFLFAYFISWGWILSIVMSAIGGITMRILITKLIEDYVNRRNNTDTNEN